MREESKATLIQIKIENNEIPQRITAKFYSWFSSCCLCTVEHPTFGKHQVTPQQYKHSPAEYKNKLRKNILDMFLKGELDMEKYKKHC